MDMRHKLDKKTQDRHFPEMHGGKGSSPRKSTKSTRELYADNYDRIFNKKADDSFSSIGDK